MYSVLSMLFLFLVYREIERGPDEAGIKLRPPEYEPELAEVR